MVQVIYIHRNIPGVLRQVNKILGDHNVDKQMTDSRGDVAYLMADISDVDTDEIKNLWQSLEELNCKTSPLECDGRLTDANSVHTDSCAVLDV